MSQRLRDVSNTHQGNLQKPAPPAATAKCPKRNQAAAGATPNTATVARGVPAQGAENGRHGNVAYDTAGKAVAAVEDQRINSSGWQQRLWDCLQSGAPPSSFACTHTLPTSDMPAGCPALTVEGAGQLALPLSHEQAAALRAAADQAPFGKRLATVVDTNVRNALQVDASKVFLGSSWHQVLEQAILPAVAEGLGLESPPESSVTAELYKLLLYETGGHFAAHRDTEKAPGMFATLVVQLPCGGGHEGGQLVVRHGGQQLQVDTAQVSATAIQYTAFFADCEHELLPVTAGRRLVLTYNLCWVGQGSTPHAPDGHQAAELAAAVGAWERQLAAGACKPRLALQLEHQYTSANVSFANLKGTDRRMAQTLMACPLLDIHLALLTHNVTGSTDSPVVDRYSNRGRSRWGSYNKRRRCRYDDEEDEEASEEEHSGGGSSKSHTMLEVHDATTETQWYAPDGSSIPYEQLCTIEEFFHPGKEELFGSDDEPDDETYEEYTGNSGPTLEYVYHRAVLVLWPRNRSLAMACSTCPEAVLSLLAVRLQELTTGIMGDASSAQVHAQAALNAAIICLKVASEQPASYGGYGKQQSTTPAGSAPVYALQLLVRARAAGLSGTEHAAAEVLGMVISQPGTTDVSLPAVLPQLLDALRSEALNTAMLLLVRSLGAAHAQGLAVLVGSVGAQPELQQQVALAVAKELQAASVCGAASTTQTGTAPQMETWACLIAAVTAQPALKQQLTLAAVETLLSSDAIFAQQQPASVVQLSDLLLTSPGLHPTLYGRLATACMRRPDCQAVLQELLQSAAVTTRPPLHQQLALIKVDMLLTSNAAFGQQSPAAVQELAEILLASPSLTASHWNRFATACTWHPNCQAVLQQLLRSAVVKACPPVHQQLALGQVELLLNNATVFGQQSPAAVLELAELVLASPSLTASHLNRFAAACLWHPNVQAVLQQLLQSSVVQAMPRLHQQLALVKTELLLDNAAVFAQQSQAAVLELADELLSDPELRATHCTRFAAACLRRKDWQPLVQQLLQRASVKAAVALPGVQQLVEAQLAYLRTHSAQDFSWCMPQASLPSYPLVEAFLRGPQQQEAFEGIFTGIGQARNWAEAYFNKNNGANTTYSAVATAHGHGRNAYCAVMKTRDWFDRQPRQGQSQMEAERARELEMVAAMWRGRAA